MSRIITASLTVLFLVLMSAKVSAQDLPMPGRGEILELRRDDPRASEGYRSFIFGSWVSGMGGLDTVLGRVNADLEDGSLVTMEQLDAANPCVVIYHREGHGPGHNGSCDTNPRSERVSYASFCGGDRSCARWPMAHRVYRIPSRARLTPGERAEEMLRNVDTAPVTTTVPAPAELGGQLTELSDLMSEEQPPTYEQVRGVIGAFGRALVRASEATPATAPATGHVAAVDPANGTADMDFNEADVASTPTSPSDPATTGSGAIEHDTSSMTSADTTPPWFNPFLLWLVIAILSLAMILLLLKDNIRAWFRPTITDDEEQETPATSPALPRLSADEEWDLKIVTPLKRRWKEYFRNLGRGDQLSVENLLLFFDTADTNRVLVEDREERLKEIDALKDQVGMLTVAKTALPIESPRVAQLERELADSKSAKSTAEASVIKYGFEHATAIRKKDEEIVAGKSEIQRIKGELESFKARALALAEQFYQEGVANLELALDHASRSGESSTPSFVIIIERISNARDLFQSMTCGVLNDLLIHLDSDMAMVPSMAFEPASVPPVSADVPIPSKESLKGETTNPGVQAPVPSIAEDVAFRLSQHAPPLSSKKGKREQKREERRRKTTDSFERAPVAEAIEARVLRDEEKTGVFDPAKLKSKKLEARTGKTIVPASTFTAKDDSPIPGSLVPPPPPIVAPIVQNGEEPDPTEAGSRPASLSIFDDVSASSEETGVTVKRAVGKD